MSDFRNAFLKSVEQSLVSILEPEKLKEVVDKVTIVLGDYEITERCTDIVPLDTTNTKLIKRYCACLKVDGRSEKTIYRYKRTVRKLSDFVQKPFTEMGTYDIRFFLASEKERGISERTLENMRANLSAFFQWLTIEEEIVKNPMLAIKPIKYADEIREPFSEVEIDKLRFACRTEKERALIEFLLATGVRVSEVSEMSVMDVDFQTLTVHVEHGKGGNKRITYITPVAMERLKKYLADRKEQESVNLFCNIRHGKLTPCGIRYILNEIADRAGVENVHPHRFRRTFATKLAKRGMDIQEIQKLLGHSNIATTMEYICTDDENVKSSYRKYIA